jgi:2-C-methyl-D-erythritol 2,4-cyclodiphosphate synthase
MMRIGHGYDVHALVAGRKLVLGGVTIAHDKGLAGHSDADVLIHAICDACLGAAGLGDIGRHFPDTDPRYKGIDSRVLLRQVHDLIRARGWLLGNVDCTLVAQAPKLAPHLSAMAANLAIDLRVVPEQINIKATTTEKLGFAGRGEGIAAHAVVLLTPV